LLEVEILTVSHWRLPRVKIQLVDLFDYSEGHLVQAER
jgi:hypothetical protein